MAGPGVILKAMPSRLGWTPWPEGGSCRGAQEGSRTQTHILECGWIEATKERGDLGMGTPVHPSIHFIKHRRYWALC